MFAFTGPSDGQGCIAKVQDFTLSQYSAMITFLVAYSPATRGQIAEITRDLTEPKIGAVKVTPASNGGADIMQNLEISKLHPTFIWPMAADMFSLVGVPANISCISAVSPSLTLSTMRLS